MPYESVIVQEFIQTLNRNLTDEVSEQDAVKIIQKALNTAFSSNAKSITDDVKRISERKKLWQALQLILEDDKLVIVNEPYARVLISKGWRSVAQRILNNVGRSEALYSWQERIIDFSINAWMKIGVPARFVRYASQKLHVAIGLAIGFGGEITFFLIAPWSVLLPYLMVFLTGVLSVNGFYLYYFGKEALHDVMQDFKKNHVSELAEMTKDCIRKLRVIDYDSHCASTKSNYPDYSPEEMKEAEASVYSEFWSMSDEEFIESLERKKETFDFDKELDLAILNTGFYREMFTANALMRAIMMPLSDDLVENVAAVGYRFLLAIGGLLLLPTLLVMKAAILCLVLKYLVLYALYQSIVTTAVLLVTLPVNIVNVVLDVINYLKSLISPKMDKNPTPPATENRVKNISDSNSLPRDVGYFDSPFQQTSCLDSDSRALGMRLGGGVDDIDS